MRIFDYSKLKERTWDNEILAYVAQIHEYKGKQDLYLKQKPVELNRLIEIAKIQSTESSNQIEGIADSLILIPNFILDFLCIHLFNDENGRMSRLLTVWGSISVS